MDEEGSPAVDKGKNDEGDYVRNRNRTISRKLCIILDIKQPEDILKTVLELVYFKGEAVRNQRARPTAWQEKMAIEGSPDAGEGAQEPEGNYFHQPQLEPDMHEEGMPDTFQGAQEGDYAQYYQGWQDTEPMNQEAEEAMARRREEAYIRNRNNSIVHRLSIMLEVGDPEEIVQDVAELLYYWWQGKEFQEPVAKRREEPTTDEEAAARAEAIELRNKAIEADDRADKIRKKANWFPPEDEDPRDYADENNLRLYGDRVNEVTTR
jgi:hypothetical protein